jgi:hypothetical protein
MKATSVNENTRQAAPLRNKFSVFGANTLDFIQVPATLVRFASSPSRTPAVLLFNASRDLFLSR